MKKHTVTSMILGAILALVGAVESASAQETAPTTKSPGTAIDKPRDDIQHLNQSIQELNERVGTLTKELQRFKTDVDEVATLWRVLLMEQRQGQLEERLAAVQRQLFDMSSQELAIRSRLQNLDKEFIPSPSAFITQDQIKRQIRQQLEQQLQQIASQRPELTEREKELKEQLTDLRGKLEAFKRDLEAIGHQRDAQKQEQEEQP
jgi:peptidoglycan hydrolase CwlO-like protein